MTEVPHDYLHLVAKKSGQSVSRMAMLASMNEVLIDNMLGLASITVVRDVSRSVLRVESEASSLSRERIVQSLFWRVFGGSEPFVSSGTTARFG
jgi:hypothetical protein